MSMKWCAQILAVAAIAAIPVTYASPPQEGQTAPDNTKANKKDRSGAAPTADDAKQNSADVELMRKIRSSIVKDKSISTYGRNVKVIAQDGRVTLRGPVRSEEEKHLVGSKAAEIAGAGNVVNELTVKA